jgi:TusA-related sulfurtransferase
MHTARRLETATVGGILEGMTAKEQVLKEAPRWSEATATAVLRVVEAQSKLEAWFERESKLSPEQVREREARWARDNARELIHEEPW